MYRVFAPQEGSLAPSRLKASRILKEDLMIDVDLAQREWPKSRFAAV